MQFEHSTACATPKVWRLCDNPQITVFVFSFSVYNMGLVTDNWNTNMQHAVIHRCKCKQWYNLMFLSWMSLILKIVFSFLRRTLTCYFHRNPSGKVARNAREWHADLHFNQLLCGLGEIHITFGLDTGYYDREYTWRTGWLLVTVSRWTLWTFIPHGCQLLFLPLLIKYPCYV